MGAKLSSAFQYILPCWLLNVTSTPWDLRSCLLGMIHVVGRNGGVEGLFTILVFARRRRAPSTITSEILPCVGLILKLGQAHCLIVARSHVGRDETPAHQQAAQRQHPDQQLFDCRIQSIPRFALRIPCVTSPPVSLDGYPKYFPEYPALSVAFKVLKTSKALPSPLDASGGNTVQCFAAVLTRTPGLF